MMAHCCCYCIIPRHSSALSEGNLLLDAVRLASSHGETDGHGLPAETEKSRDVQQTCKYNMLILQCHSEGAFWKGLVPMLLPETSGCNKHHSRKKRQSTCTSQSHALSALLHHFHSCTRLVSSITNTSLDDEIHYPSESSQSKQACTENAMHSSSIIMQCCRYKHTSSKSMSLSPLILVLLPPNPNNYLQHCYSRTPSSSPTNLFTLRLIYNENNFIRLTSLSAYISTLGGGFFLCHYLSTAVSLARQQCHIALLRGDTEMSLKCRINEGYCYIHAGKLNTGKRVLRRVLEDVIRLQGERGVDKEEYGLLHHTKERELHELTVIRNMCYSALRFANLIRDKMREEEEEEEGEHDKEGGDSSPDHRSGNNKDKEKRKMISATHDDFQRIRVVQDRRWR